MKADHAKILDHDYEKFLLKFQTSALCILNIFLSSDIMCIINILIKQLKIETKEETATKVINPMNNFPNQENKK